MREAVPVGSSLLMTAFTALAFAGPLVAAVRPVTDTYFGTAVVDP